MAYLAWNKLSCAILLIVHDLSWHEHWFLSHGPSSDELPWDEDGLVVAVAAAGGGIYVGARNKLEAAVFVLHSDAG